MNSDVAQDLIHAIALRYLTCPEKPINLLFHSGAFSLPARAILLREDDGLARIDFESIVTGGYEQWEDHEDVASMRRVPHAQDQM